MKQITKYENELLGIINTDKNNWAKFYLLMKDIEQKELFKEAGKNSFTAWIKDFSIKNKIHESVIWNRKKAGKVYESYQQVQSQRGIETKPIQELDVSMESLVILDKIAKKDSKLGAELTEKALNKEITREDLRTAYKTVRGDLVINKNNYYKHEKSDIPEDNKLAGIKVDIKETVTAAKIVNSFNNSAWLGKECKRKAFKGSYEQDKYKTLTEFPVYTGMSSKSRRIDLLVAENLTVVSHYELNLHGVEIKVSKGDLIGDTKYTEYAEYVNYLWLAIPRDLIEVAEKNVPDVVGILVLENEKISIYKKAKTLNPFKLNESLTTLSLRLL